MTSSQFYQQLKSQLHSRAQQLGFSGIGVTDTDLRSYIPRARAWIFAGNHQPLQWMAEQLPLKEQPGELVPGTLRIISLRMDYLPSRKGHIDVLKNPTKAYIARYALGRDYHKTLRKRIALLGDYMRDLVREQCSEQEIHYRAFVDSAPIMERPLAEKAGLGWIGKNSLIINAQSGSFFLLGELFTNLPLPLDELPAENQCGDCTACLTICPTDAFKAPYVLQTERCIAYLTIENKGPIPLEFREAIGNRIFGCDDCQAICPWNKFAGVAQVGDFAPRHNLDSADLLTLFNWNEDEFLRNTQGSALRRIDYPRFLRNVVIGLGNAPSDPAIIAALEQRSAQAELFTEEISWLSEHFAWALAQQHQPNRRRKRKIKRTDR
ncbi:MAG TPA: tRNA epoxyqueuosine(34) reductase QueG [Cellvibrionaceae bacterium]